MATRFAAAGTSSPGALSIFVDGHPLEKRIAFHHIGETA
jgi:hypothetical protein